MLNRHTDNRMQMEMVSIEELVSSNHLLRKIEAAVDFSYILELVSEYYDTETGRPGVDPVVLFKLVLLQHLYGIKSLRGTLREAEMNMAYRWFLSYGLTEKLPHFATVSYAFCERYGSEVAEAVFQWILCELENAGYLEPAAVFVDATHIKASANVRKLTREAIPTASRIYDEQLRAEINADRESHDKPPFDDDAKAKNKRDNTSRKKLARRKKDGTAAKSTTDPDSGLFCKGEHQKCFAYEVSTACDKNNVVLAAEVTPGNVHDSVSFDPLYEKVTERFAQIETIVADSAYKTPWICKRIFDDNRVLSTAYKRPMTRKGGHEWWKYVYDEHNDWVICPEYKTLYYATTNRDGYREYKCREYHCMTCPTKHLCTNARFKTVTRHVWQDYIELADDARYTPEYMELYARRKETIERVFADAKENHGMRYTNHRGLARVTAWVKLKFAAMNLKKLAIWRWRKLVFLCFDNIFTSFITKQELSLAA